MTTIVITGASQGIGAALAKAFSEEKDVRLALLARNVENLTSVSEACTKNGAKSYIFPCDVTDEAAVKQVAGQIEEKFGAPDILINNAGVFLPGSILETTGEMFRNQVDVNLNSAFYVTRAFLGEMMARKSGHIFYMASVASIQAYAGGSAYCAAKHGLLGLARVVREETKSAGVRVTAIMPGATLTPSWDGVDLPEERFMPADDIANAVIDIWKLSQRSVVEEIVLRPQEGDI